MLLKETCFSNSIVMKMGEQKVVNIVFITPFEHMRFSYQHVALCTRFVGKSSQVKSHVNDL